MQQLQGAPCTTREHLPREDNSSARVTPVGPFDYPRVGPESPHVRLHWDPKIDGSTGQDRKKAATRTDMNGNGMKEKDGRKRPEKKAKGRNGAKAKEAGQACHTVSCLLNFGRVTQV